jgi:5'-deoxynucleotidase YfbR-like HD superfamily hydrolase
LIDLAKKVCEQRPELDERKLLRMLQIHDWPEVIAGDTMTYSENKEEIERIEKDKRGKETAAMEFISGNLGEEGRVIRALWEEFEANQTPEAKVANQLDKLQATIKAVEYEKAGEKVSALQFWNGYIGKIDDPLILRWFTELDSRFVK